MKNFNDAEFCAILEASGYKLKKKHVDYDFWFVKNENYIYWDREYDYIKHENVHSIEECYIQRENWRKLESFIGEPFVIPEPFNFGNELEKLEFIRGGDNTYYSKLKSFPAIRPYNLGATIYWQIGGLNIKPTPENLEYIKIALNALKELK